MLRTKYHRILRSSTSSSSEISKQRHDQVTRSRVQTYHVQYDNLILDLGGVLAFHSAKGLDLPISGSMIRRLLDSPPWNEQECGTITRQECYNKLEKMFGVAASDIHETLRLLTGTLSYNEELLTLIRQLKSKYSLKVYMISNITSTDWKLLRPVVERWNIFDGLFKSFEMGCRKPHFQIFQDVFAKAVFDPNRAIFIDDKLDNILAAQVLGMRTIHFDEPERVMQRLHATFASPVKRGEAWLRTHAGKMWSFSDTGVLIQEIFGQLVILELTGDITLVKLPIDVERQIFWNCFGDNIPVLTDAKFPNDLDTSSLALLHLEVPAQVCEEAMDEMLKCMSEDGLFYVRPHFAHLRPYE